MGAFTCAVHVCVPLCTCGCSRVCTHTCVNVYTHVCSYQARVCVPGEHMFVFRWTLDSVCSGCTYMCVFTCTQMCVRRVHICVFTCAHMCVLIRHVFAFQENARLLSDEHTGVCSGAHICTHMCVPLGHVFVFQVDRCVFHATHYYVLGEHVLHLRIIFALQMCTCMCSRKHMIVFEVCACVCVRFR